MKTKFSSKAKLALIAVLATAAIGLSSYYMTGSTDQPEAPISYTSQILDSWASQFGPPVTSNQQLTTANMTTPTPLIPGDIYRPTNGKNPNHKDLAIFAWLEFISLVSPKGAVRGETGGSFASSGMPSNTTPLVWESYQHRSELFPFNGNTTMGRAPAPWDSTPNYQMYFTVDKIKKKVNIPYDNYNLLDETTQIGQNHIFFPKNPAQFNPAEDYQLLFEAKVNQGSWSYANENYSKFSNLSGNFPKGLEFPGGTIEVKATWRPIASIAPKDRYRYHTSEVIYFTGEDSNPTAVTGEYALIGLHIIHKTPNYPTFIFATFEHTDILNNQGQETGLYYVPTYENIAYSLPPSTDLKFPVQETVTNATYPTGWLSAPSAPLSSGNVALPKGPVGNIGGAQPLPPPYNNDYGIPVTQPATTNQPVQAVNQMALQAMQGIPGFGPNFKWQYYFLKGVQAIPTNDQTSNDYFLANIVTESSVPGVQLFTGGIKKDTDSLTNVRNQTNVVDRVQNNHFNQGGCMGCHGVAQTQGGVDFSFLYFSRTKGFNVETIGLGDEEVNTAKLKKYLDLIAQ